MSANTFEVTAGNFQDEVLNSSAPVLVDFWAEWCGPCKMIGPLVEELSTEFGDKMRVGKLDADRHPIVLQQYNIMSIPTLILFKEGQPVARVVGFKPKEELLKKIQPHLS